MIAPESIAEILGLQASIRGVSELEAAVSARLPKRSMEHLSKRLHLDRTVASAYKFKVFPQATRSYVYLAGAMLHGWSLELGRRASDR